MVRLLLQLIGFDACNVEVSWLEKLDEYCHALLADRGPAQWLNSVHVSPIENRTEASGKRNEDRRHRRGKGREYPTSGLFG